MRQQEDNGVSPSGPGCQPSALAADASSRSGIPDAQTDWVEFMVWPRNGTMKQAVPVRIRLKRPIRLYDEEHLSPFRKARARAWRLARRELELSPSMPMRAEPHDWSDGVEALSRATGGSD